jgi:hypothetical protein
MKKFISTFGEPAVQGIILIALMAAVLTFMILKQTYSIP